MKRIGFRPRLRTLLLLTNLMTLLLPVGGIVLLHLYESELVRQTESALIGQGALLAATFREDILRNAPPTGLDFSDKPVASQSLFGKGDHLTPIHPQLDVAKETIYPTAKDASPPAHGPDPIARMAGKALEPILRDAQRITLAGIRLVDHNGIVVASSGSEYGLSLINRKEVRQALKGNYISLMRQRISDEAKPGITSMSRKAWLRVFVALPVIENDHILGAVVLSRSPIGVGRGLYLIKNHLIKAAAILLALVILVSLAASFAIARPINALIRQADEVRKGDEKAAKPLAHPGTIEVERLSESIAQMASSLAKRADYIETFARNVSHEFKTPITSLRGSVELLQDHGQTMTEDEKHHFLSNMSKDIDKLDSMVVRLLELARADMVRPGEVSCDLSDIFQKLDSKYSEAGKDVIFKAENRSIVITMDREILSSILTNLIDNGLQHGGENTQVTVTAQQKNNGTTLLHISDNGAGVSASNAKKIFRPFFTTARHAGGTGLGLSIVQSLLSAHNGTIELVSTTEGTSFQLVISPNNSQQKDGDR